jgi:hypothetical protein
MNRVRRAVALPLAVVIAVILGAQVGRGYAASMTLATSRITTFSGPAGPDTTAPQLATLEMFDVNANGRIDRVVATFDEALATPYTAGVTGWTLANVPSAGTLASVSVSGATATLTITEGAGAAATNVGTFTIALTSTALGIRDAAGNRSSFAATAPADKAGPVPTFVTVLVAGATAGRMQTNDQLAVLFSEALLPASVPATTTVTETDPAGAATIDTISIPGVFNGTLSTGGAAYIGVDGASASGPATGALGFGNAAILVTLTGCTCGSAGTGQGTFVFVAATSITDAAANAATGSYTTATTFRLF